MKNSIILKIIIKIYKNQKLLLDYLRTILFNITIVI